MKPLTSIRIPVSVRVGRLRWSFCMPPIYVRMSATRDAAAEYTVHVASRSGVAHRAAMLALRVALVPAAVLSRVFRTTAEVTIGSEEAP